MYSPAVEMWQVTLVKNPHLWKPVFEPVLEPVFEIINIESYLIQSKLSRVRCESGIDIFAWRVTWDYAYINLKAY